MHDAIKLEIIAARVYVSTSNKEPIFPFDTRIHQCHDRIKIGMDSTVDGSILSFFKTIHTVYISGVVFLPRLTARLIDENVRRPSQRQKIIRDDDLKGIGLHVTKGSMSWIAEVRVDGKLKRLTLGKYELMAPEQARNDCRKLLQRHASIEQRLAVPTLSQVMEKYLEVRSLSKNTLRNYKHLAERCLKDWYNLPMTSITKDMVLARHRELTRPTHQGTAGKVQANSAMSYLNSLFRFAMHHYESEDGKPLIVSNPVVTLSQNRVWHRTGVRRVIIPDHKLSDWYQAVLSLRQKMIRDYLLVLILTGLRKNEAAKLRWTDIDLLLAKSWVQREWHVKSAGNTAATLEQCDLNYSNFQSSKSRPGRLCVCHASWTLQKALRL